MKGLVVALQFLTRLPLPRIAVSDDEFARSMRWFPAAGLVVGGIVAAGGWGAAKLDPWLGALVALLLWVGVTGALHLDGLGDVADAAGAAHADRARLSAVLADPHIGSFGVVAIALQLAAKLVLLHLALENGRVPLLLLAPLVARIGPLVWTRGLPPLHDGLGALFHGVALGGALTAWGAVWLAACWFAPALAVAPLLIVAWRTWLRRRLGGISGDGHGAGIELVESGLLMADAIAMGLQ